MDNENMQTSAERAASKFAQYLRENREQIAIAIERANEGMKIMSEADKIKAAEIYGQKPWWPPRPKDEKLLCPKCSNNSHATEEVRSKTHPNDGALQMHLAAPLHTPYGEFRTRYDYNAEQNCNNGDSKPYKCEYGCGEAFEDWNELECHINRSERSDYGEDHWKLKVQDGWHTRNLLPGAYCSEDLDAYVPFRTFD